MRTATNKQYNNKNQWKEKSDWTVIRFILESSYVACAHIHINKEKNSRAKCFMDDYLCDYR